VLFGVFSLPGRKRLAFTLPRCTRGGLERRLLLLIQTYLHTWYRLDVEERRQEGGGRALATSADLPSPACSSLPVLHQPRAPVCQFG